VRRVTSSDGVDLAVHELGPDAAGQPVLVAHATGFHGRVWAPLARRLTGHAGWAPDLRGHGHSPAPADGDYAWDGFADDVLASVDGLGLQRPVGVGHSKGGAALLLAEARRPGSFRALWLYEPVVFPPDPEDPSPPAAGPRVNPLAEGARRRHDHFDSFEAAEANFASKPPMDGFDPEVRHEYVRHGFRPDPAGGVRLACRPDDEATVYEMGRRHKAWDHLGSLRLPVTVVRGAITDSGPASVAAAVVERLPAGRLEVHDELSHFGPLEDPAGMASSILAALRGG